MKKKGKRTACFGLALVMVCSFGVLSGCSGQTSDGKIHIDLLHYKMEAADYFNKLAEEFNAQNPDIVLEVESPNDAMTILKTRLIREDPPDIVGIGGDINYSYFLDSDMLLDLSDYAGVADVKQSYLDIAKTLEFVPLEGTYSIPYAANASGVLYNKTMFEEHGWKTPTTWSEFMALCEQIQSEGVAPFTLGYKDAWTSLAPWNSLAVSLVDPGIFDRVNLGEDTFANGYDTTADRIAQLTQYSGNDPISYGYNDSCTAFAREQCAMYPIGSFAMAQIKTVNPDLQIGSFVMPASETADENILNSGIDLQFSIMKDAVKTPEEKEACYRVLDFLQQNDSIQSYITDQTAVPCKEGDFTLAPELEGMQSYIDSGKMADYQDHHYPAEMGVDAHIQSFIIDGDKEKFFTWFDQEWIKANRDMIAKQKAYAEAHGGL